MKARSQRAAIGAGAAGLAVMLQASPAAAQEAFHYPSYRESLNAGAFIGFSFLPSFQLTYGIEARLGKLPAVFLRLEGRGIDRARVTLGAMATTPDPVPVIGELGLSFSTGTRLLGPAGGFHLGAGFGWTGEQLVLQGFIPAIGDLRNYDVNAVGILLFPESAPWLSPFRPVRVGRRLRSAPGVSPLPNMVPGQEVPLELRTYGPDAERQLIAAHWIEATRTEGAAIASFQRLSLELASLDAPGKLVAGARDAAREEARHASLCADLAARWTGQRLLPDVTELSPRWSEPMSEVSAELARETLEDGLLDEGAGGLVLAEAARRASDRPTREALTSIAHDEAGHTAHAWATLEWLWRSNAKARDAIVETVAAVTAPSPASEQEVADAELVRRYGLLSAAEEARIIGEHYDNALSRIRKLVRS